LNELSQLIESFVGDKSRQQLALLFSGRLKQKTTNIDLFQVSALSCCPGRCIS
jgi:hypothetical protein